MIKESPNDPYQYLVAGEIEFRLKRFKESRKYLDLANQIDNRLPHAWMLLGFIQSEMQEKDDAIDSLRRARILRKGPNENDLILAQIMWQSGNLEEAHRIYSEVARASHYWREDFFRLETARILLHWNKFTEAKAVLDSLRNLGTWHGLFRGVNSHSLWTVLGLEQEQDIYWDDLRTYLKKLRYLVDMLAARKILPVNFYEEMGNSEVVRLLLEKDIEMIRKWSAAHDTSFQHQTKSPVTN